MAKATDPFISVLWDALLEARLSPGGHDTPWAETSTRTRNRFAKAVRQTMQSGAAFGAVPLDKVPVYATRAIDGHPQPGRARKKRPRR